MMMRDNYIQGILTQTIKMYDYRLVSDGPGSHRSLDVAVWFCFTKRRKRGGLASNSHIVPGDATELGCGECVLAFNAFNPATDPATKTYIHRVSPGHVSIADTAAAESLTCAQTV